MICKDCKEQIKDDEVWVHATDGGHYHTKCLAYSWDKISNRKNNK